MKIYLDKFDIDKDNGWYSEDFPGCDLDGLTDNKAEDSLVLYTARINEVLGISLNPLKRIMVLVNICVGMHIASKYKHQNISLCIWPQHTY